jgi:exonuclease III
MLTFLFWNLHNRPLQSSVVNLAYKHEVDILILAECRVNLSYLLLLLNEREKTLYDYAPSPACKRIQIFTRFPSEYTAVVLEDERLTARHIEVPSASKPILLVGLHLPSKRFWDEADQAIESVIFADLIKQAEKIVNHQRTVLIGDFNMNPFDRGVVNANGFHGVMSKQVARKKERTVQGKSYPFFYNPMWGLLGDATPGSPGTYFYQTSGHASYFWHMFDQVLLRPDLLENFDNADLKILDTDGEISFLTTDGRPNVEEASDHLPILFRLNL